MTETAPDEQLRTVAAFALRRREGSSVWVEASGASMGPLIREGDTLHVEFEPRRYRIGEIVVFPEGGRIVAHRLVGRIRTAAGEMLLTRGDATVRLDAPFPAEQAFGVARACRRAPDGAPTPILPGGLRAVVLAVVSRTGAQLVLRAERLRPALGHPLGAATRRLAGVSVSRLANLLARPPRRPSPG